MFTLNMATNNKTQVVIGYENRIKVTVNSRL